MKKNEIVAVAALILVVYTLGLYAVGQVVSMLQTDKTISNAGTIKAVGVGVYWNPDCTNTVTSINWGTLEPDSNETATVYIRNEGNSASTLSMYTSNWSPSNASDYMALGWDYGGQSLNPGDVVEVTFTLVVSSSIEGITSFSFDIIIVGNA